jgi:hypothetical protein
LNHLSTKLTIHFKPSNQIPVTPSQFNKAVPTTITASVRVPGNFAAPLVKVGFGGAGALSPPEELVVALAGGMTVLVLKKAALMLEKYDGV